MKLIIRLVLLVLSAVMILFLIMWGFHGFPTKSSGQYVPVEKEEQSIKTQNEEVFKNGTRVCVN